MNISCLLESANLSPEEFNVLEGETVSTLCLCNRVNIPKVSQEDTQVPDDSIPAVKTFLCNDSAVPDRLEGPLLFSWSVSSTRNIYEGPVSVTEGGCLPSLCYSYFRDRFWQSNY